MNFHVVAATYKANVSKTYRTQQFLSVWSQKSWFATEAVISSRKQLKTYSFVTKALTIWPKSGFDQFCDGEVVQGRQIMKICVCATDFCENDYPTTAKRLPHDYPTTTPRLPSDYSTTTPRLLHDHLGHMFSEFCRFRHWERRNMWKLCVWSVLLSMLNIMYVSSDVGEQCIGNHSFHKENITISWFWMMLNGLCLKHVFHRVCWRITYIYDGFLVHPAHFVLISMISMWIRLVSVWLQRFHLIATISVWLQRFRCNHAFHTVIRCWGNRWIESQGRR